MLQGTEPNPKPWQVTTSATFLSFSSLFTLLKIVKDTKELSFMWVISAAIYHLTN